MIDRIRAAIESGNLPNGVTAEQAAARLAVLENVLATGELPDGVERPHAGRPGNVGRDGHREVRIQAIIDRIRAAIESENLPHGVMAEQAAGRLAVLENALAAGERPVPRHPGNPGAG